MYLVGHAQYCLLAYHRSDRRLTIGPKQEDENGNGDKERVPTSRKHNGDSKSRKGGTCAERIFMRRDRNRFSLRVGQTYLLDRKDFVRNSTRETRLFLFNKQEATFFVYIIIAISINLSNFTNLAQHFFAS